MPDPTVISIDAMGGDHGPPIAVAGVAHALDEWRRRNVSFVLHGDQARIQVELAKTPGLAAISRIRHTDLVIASDDKAAQAMRRGKGSSLWNAIDAVDQGQAHACVSAGNTGALMAISMLILRMAAGLERPAIVALWPSLRGFTTVLDVGANVDCDAERLIEFAIMGEAFHRAMQGAAKPTVGLLNVGSEDQKGHEEVREAHRILREHIGFLDYHGFVEGDDISKGVVDVVVTDGFTGNIALKTAEGMARFIGGEIREAFRASPVNMLGALIARSALGKLRARLDPSAHNGAPLLGLNGIVVKSHGGSDAKGFANAIRVAVDLAQSPYLTDIQQHLEQLMAVREQQQSGCGAIPAPAPPSENNG
ncbi:MAG TPA: phosphate acyltransferase PlsX [Caulobacteraceae bacterium]|nr:phosphate acyltransferase PlsX [Caulobacteraceae bacterium]